MVELGKYIKKAPTHSHCTWQNYQIYLYYYPRAGQQYAVYGKWGFQQLSDDIAWTQIYGGSTVWSFQNGLDLTFVYEYTHQNGRYHRGFLLSRLRYQFNNGQNLAFKCNWNRQSNQSNSLDLLVSYTIPWNLPVGKKARSGAKGKLTKVVGNQEVPLSNVLVHCDDRISMTNKKGEFAFSHLRPGNYSFWLEDAPREFVSTQSLPLNLDLPAGKVSNLHLTMERSTRVYGKIALYEIANDTPDTTFGSTKKSSNISFSPSSNEYKKKLLSQRDYPTD